MSKAAMFWACRETSNTLSVTDSQSCLIVLWSSNTGGRLTQEPSHGPNQQALLVYV